MTADGGVERFEEEFSDLFLPAFRVALRLLGSIEEAEDVAAEALARALRSWDRVGELPYRKAWVAKVASNLAVDKLRRRPAAIAPPDHVPDMAEAVALRLAVGAALTALPRRQRQVIALRYLADLSEADVAVSLGISSNSVKKHSARAVAALRSRLGPDWQEANVALD